MSEDRLAKHGEKMVEIRVRFWTDSIASTKGQIRPRHAWSGGVVMMQRNEAHSISPKSPTPFNNMGELPDVIERVLIAHGVKLHPSGRDAKVWAAADPQTKT